jgi:hypothetical protein
MFQEEAHLVARGGLLRFLAVQYARLGTERHDYGAVGPRVLLDKLTVAPWETARPFLRALSPQAVLGPCFSTGNDAAGSPVSCGPIYPA